MSKPTTNKKCRDRIKSRNPRNGKTGGRAPYLRGKNTKFKYDFIFTSNGIKVID